MVQAALTDTLSLQKHLLSHSVSGIFFAGFDLLAVWFLRLKTIHSCKSCG